jgi:hypothetical protein
MQLTPSTVRFQANDCRPLAGKIDDCYKVSQPFARNTVDSLTTCANSRKSIEFSSKRKIYGRSTARRAAHYDNDSLAQEESRSISENCTWVKESDLPMESHSTVQSFLVTPRRGCNLVVNPSKPPQSNVFTVCSSGHDTLWHRIQADR